MIKKFFQKNSILLLLFLILAIALFFRLYKLSNIPPSLNWDEVSHGYNAYSVLKTGKDEWGFKLPLIFRAYGDFKLPLYVYLTVLSEIFFGLNVFSVRLVSIISGVGLVLLAYLITKKITNSEKYSLLACLLAAITPWGLFLSRIAVEANLGAFLFVAGVYLLLEWLKTLKSKWLVFTSIFWGLSLHAYNSARIIVPVFALIVVFLAIKKRKLLQLSVFLIILLVFISPIISQFVGRSAQARFDNVTLIDQGTVNKIIQLRNNSKLNPVLVRFIYNRPVFFVYYSIKNYFSNLSPTYLFFKGGSHYQFSLPDHELLYLVTALFLIIGIIKLLVKANVQEKLLLCWLIVSILPSAITKDAPHVLRTIFVLPLPAVLSAIGLKTVADFLAKKDSKLKGNLLFIVFVISVLVGFFRWSQDYLNIYPKAYSWAWQYGYREVVTYIKENYDNYEKIFITKRYGEPHEFILFYFPYEPKKYQTSSDKKWDYHANWYWVDGFDKFVFLNDWEVIDRVKERESERVKENWLLVTSPGNYPQGWNKIKTIQFQDGRPAFEILEKELRIKN